MLRRLLTLGFCGAAFLAPKSASADIYTYVDADGVVHYSNTPPEQGRDVRRVRRSPRAERPRAERTRATARSSAPAATPVDRRFDTYIREAAALYQLPEPFIRAVIKVESNYHPEVVSHAGASGLMQLMPATAARMGVTDVFDPRQNILGGTRYLRILANHFNGDLVLTIAAYNAGEGAVVRHHGIPPFEETQRYVRRVLRWYYGYLESANTGSPAARPAPATGR